MMEKKEKSEAPRKVNLYTENPSDSLELLYAKRQNVMIHAFCISIFSLVPFLNSVSGAPLESALSRALGWGQGVFSVMAFAAAGMILGLALHARSQAGQYQFHSRVARVREFLQIRLQIWFSFLLLSFLLQMLRHLPEV